MKIYNYDSISSVSISIPGGIFTDEELLMIGTYHPNHSAEEMLDMVLVITAALERQLEYANTTEDQQDAWI